MAHRTSIDLSADVGELPGAPGRELDDALIARVSTAHLATGGHAGDAQSMARGAAACARYATRLGAHPSYPDRDGFGRRRLALSSVEVVASLLGQLDELSGIAAEAGLSIESIKPHGRLYHDLSEDHELADFVFGQLAVIWPGAVVVLAAGSRAAAWASEVGLRVVAEGFCDRRYDARGALVDRAQPGAVLTNAAEVADQVRALARGGLVVHGGRHPVDSLCVHSDGPDALATLETARRALDDEGIAVEAPER